MIVSDTVICINLANLIVSYVIVLVIVILSTVVSFQYDYADVKFQHVTLAIGKYFAQQGGDKEDFCSYFFDEACFEYGDKELENKDYSGFTDNKKNDGRRVLSEIPENSLRQLYKFDTSKSVSTALKHGKNLNKAGYIISVVDIAIRTIEFFVLCCGNQKRTCRHFLAALVIISFCLLIGYLVCFSAAYNRFNNIKSISDDFVDYFASQLSFDEDEVRKQIEEVQYPKFHSYLKDIKNTRKILIGLIVLSCICVPLLIVALVIAFCCGGLTIVNKDTDSDDREVEVRGK